MSLCEDAGPVKCTICQHMLGLNMGVWNGIKSMILEFNC